MGSAREIWEVEGEGLAGVRESCKHQRMKHVVKNLLLDLTEGYVFRVGCVRECVRVCVCVCVCVYLDIQFIPSGCRFFAIT